jgi:predicted aminopeptidase
MHAGAGQFRMLYHSVPIDEALKDESITPDQKDHLKLVAEIKAFGEKELGLKKTRNYQTVFLRSRQSPIYTVSASPKDRLTLVTWWFPVAGRMPYLGFFNLESARSKRDALLRKDLDVMIGRADAYSTLGWFKDPVTLNLLEGSTNNLVETILHEMTHTTLYVKGQGAFNEGLANLIGKVGAIAFLQKSYGPSHPLTLEAEMILEDERLFATFMDTLIERLEILYDSSFPYNEKLIQREKIFQESQNEFNQLKAKLNTDRFTYFGTSGLNNAYIMAVGLYHRYFNDFETVYGQRGYSVKKTLRFFQDMAGKESDMLNGMKIHLKEWGPRFEGSTLKYDKTFENYSVLSKVKGSENSIRNSNPHTSFLSF